MATYLIGSLGRREILLMTVVIAGSGAVLPLTHAAAEGALQRTPDQILGPFYPLKELSTDSDLTRVPGRSGRGRAGSQCYGAGAERCRTTHSQCTSRDMASE